MKGPASRTQTDKRFQSYRNEHRRIQDILPLFPGRMREFDFCCLKCDPDEAIDLRDRYEGIEPGYHMNKRHWINVRFDRDVPDSEIRRLVRRSYELVAGRSDRKR